MLTFVQAVCSVRIRMESVQIRKELARIADEQQDTDGDVGYRFIVDVEIS